jgi:hypothetical protein
MINKKEVIRMLLQTWCSQKLKTPWMRINP